MSLIFPAIICDLKLIESLLFFRLNFSILFFFFFRSIALSLAVECRHKYDSSIHPMLYYWAIQGTPYIHLNYQCLYRCTGVADVFTEFCTMYSVQYMAYNETDVQTFHIHTNSSYGAIDLILNAWHDYIVRDTITIWNVRQSMTHILTVVSILCAEHTFGIHQ